MPRILRDADLVTIIVTLDGSAEITAELESHARAGIELFSKFQGYVGGALHRSTDGCRLVQYLQWSSEAAYQACIDDPSWDDLPSTRRFFDAVNSGAAEVDARIFRVVTVFDTTDEGR